MAKVKAASLVLDYDLYPRHQISAENVRNIQRALEAEVDLPPVIADKSTKKVTDGFHRVTAVLRSFGPDATIEVEWRKYESSEEMLLDAMRLNAHHGQKLTSYDMARCITLGNELAIKPEQVAAALSITKERLSELEIRKTAFDPDSHQIAIKNTLRHLAGKTVTQEQMDGNRAAVGHHQMFLVNQVINLIEKDLLDRSNERLMNRLSELHGLLASQMEGVAA